MKVLPFYSKIKGRKVYHNNDKCYDGNNIELKNKRYGIDNRRLCDTCKKKNKKGE